jgi:rhodanese-related sulfurtransferase
MKIIYSAILVNILFMAIVSGCLSSTTPSEKAKYVDVSVQQGKEMIDNGEVFILDELDSRLKELPRDKKILVYCRTGHRSLTASEKLENSGFTQLYNMKGGITEWKNAGYDVVK